MPSNLTARHILLAIGGGIAAYKSAELVRQLRAAGAAVRVVMSAAATQFITPLTLQALSGEPVRQALFDASAEAAMGHIELARWADAIVVAPATADMIARLTAGIADDLLTTIVLASSAPLLLAPAMNQQMWAAAATVENVARLQQRGVILIGPAVGAQACGDVGAGRMVEPAQVVAALAATLNPPLTPLQGVSITLTAGPTREAIDPVRYISNRSSGRMGMAIAAAATAAGATVRLVCGPVALPTPAGVTRIEVETAEEMLAAVLADPGELFIGCAAVADYRVRHIANTKIKKRCETLTLELVRNPDILATVAAQRPRPFCVGFAAETDQLAAHAAEKRQRKGVDLIAANLVGRGIGFERDENALLLIWADGSIALPQAEKSALAVDLVRHIGDHYRRWQQCSRENSNAQTEDTEQ